MLAIKATSIVGLPKFDGWSQVAVDRMLHWAVAFSVSGVNAGGVGRDILNAASNLRAATPSAFHRFLQNIVQDAHNKSYNLQLVGLWVADGQAILAAYEGEILLKRQAKVGRVLQAKSELTVVEGKAKQDDTFVLLTADSGTFIGDVQQKLTQGFDVDTTVTSLVPSVHASSQSATTAIAFCQLADKNAEPFLDNNISENPVIAMEKKENVTEENTNGFSLNTTVSNNKNETESAEDKAIDLSGTSLINNHIDATKKRPLISIKNKLLNIKNIFNKNARNFTPQVDKIVHGQQYIQERTTLLQRWLIIISCIIGLALIVLAAWQWHLYAQRVAKISAEIEPFTQQLADATELAQSDPILARSQMETIIADLTNLATSHAQHKLEQKRVAAALAAAERSYEEISGKKSVANLHLFYDLRLAASDFVANAMEVVDDKAYFLDTQLGQIIVLDISTKQVEVLSTQPVTNVRAFAPTSSGIWLLGDELAFKEKNGNEFHVWRSDDGTKSADLVAAFDQYVYLLSKQNRNIYRYSLGEDPQTLSDPRRWLQSPVAIDWLAVTDFYIDGDVWLTVADGTLVRLRTGKQQEFILSGMSEQPASAIKIANLEDWQKIFLLEPNAQRLLVLNERGEFLEEIKSPSLAAVSDLAVINNGAQVLIVGGSLVYEYGQTN